MHRKRFSCFSIESLIGRGVDAQQSRQTRVADGGKETRSASCRSGGHLSPVDRTWTAYSSHIDDGSSSAEGDSRQQRTWMETSLNARTTNAWSGCLPNVVAATDNFLSTNDQRTLQLHRHFRCGLSEIGLVEKSSSVVQCESKNKTPYSCR